MIRLYSFCSPDRATGKTEMMHSFLRDEAELFVFCVSGEFNEINKRYPHNKKHVRSSFGIDQFRGLQFDKVDLLITLPRLNQMKYSDITRLSEISNYLRCGMNFPYGDVNVYIESEDSVLVEEVREAIKPNETIYLDDFLNWDENHHLIGDEIGMLNQLNKEKANIYNKISESGIPHFKVV